MATTMTISRLMHVLAVFLLLLAPCAALWTVKSSEDDKEQDEKAKSASSIPSPVTYGVDVSFPMHYAKVTNNYDFLPHNVDPENHKTPRQYKDMVVQPLGDRQSFYDDFVQGCVKHFGKKGQRCVDTENDRVEMSLRQPQSMQNYTQAGYKKIRAPESLFLMIKDFWDKNHERGSVEQWGTGNTYTNNWKSPTYMVSVEDTGLRGGGFAFKQKIWREAKAIVSEWTGQELTQCSLYGIRIYKEGAVLASHVDRLPLVSSAIINVAQDVDEPWPLEVIGHNGVAENVTMEPGDMVLYESHSVLHGRPFPLKGRYMANLFVHFEPTGHSLRHNMAMEEKRDVHQKYKEAAARGIGGHENDNHGLPPYIIPGSPEEPHWRASHPQGNTKYRGKTFTTGSTSAHTAAQSGNVQNLEAEIKKKKDIVNAKDVNGWTPLHEGARGGHLDVVKLLVENGADVDATTSNQGTVLWWAKQSLGDEHPVVEFLVSMGALEAGPEL